MNEMFERKQPKKSILKKSEGNQSFDYFRGNLKSTAGS